MFIFKMRSSSLTLLIVVFKLMTSHMSDLNHHQQYGENCSNEEFCAVVILEGSNFSQQDSNNTNPIYETVILRVATPIDVYFTPCLITLGISGNMLALYVFYSSKLRHQSTSQYLSALAISDSVFLGELFPPWLSTIEINGIFHRGAYCKGFMYISYVTCSLSSWLVIAFTVERFVAVQYPLQRSSVCTVRRARYIILSLTLGSMLVNLPVIHFAGSENQVCQIDREKLDQAAKFNWVDTTVTFTIPLILIIFFNTWIAAALYKLERDRLKLTQEELRVAAVISQHKPRDSDFLYLRSQRRVTNMLLIVSSIFVLLNCPSYTLRVYGFAYDLTEPSCRNLAKQYGHDVSPKTRIKFMVSKELDDKWLMMQNVATMMFNANFGINFYLYCFTGQNFRRALAQALPCCGWIASKFNAVFNRSPDNRGRNCSVNASAASAGTDATCTEMSSARQTARWRCRRRSGNYIKRWTFNTGRQRRNADMSTVSETISMQEIVSQPGFSRNTTDERSLPGTSHGLTLQTQAIIEPLRPIKDPNRSIADQRGPALESRCHIIEPRRTAIELGRANVQSRRPYAVSWRPATEVRRSTVESRPSAVDSRRAAIEPSQSIIDLAHPTTEHRRPVPLRVNVVPKRKSNFI